MKALCLYLPTVSAARSRTAMAKDSSASASLSTMGIAAPARSTDTNAGIPRRKRRAGQPRKTCSNCYRKKTKVGLTPRTSRNTCPVPTSLRLTYNCSVRRLDQHATSVSIRTSFANTRRNASLSKPYLSQNRSIWRTSSRLGRKRWLPTPSLKTVLRLDQEFVAHDLDALLGQRALVWLLWPKVPFRRLGLRSQLI